jgi:hypothetical protein
MADVNAAAFQVLEDKIAQFRFKVADVADDVVEDVADIINTEQRKTIAAKVDPYGKAWPAKQPKKGDDGAFRFVEPGDVVVGAIGRTIITRIKSRVPVLHHLGYARGEVVRRVIPVGGKIPPRWSERIRERVLRAFREATA